MEEKKSKKEKLVEWLKKVRKQATVIAVALLLVIGGIGIAVFTNNNYSKAAEEKKATASEEKSNKAEDKNPEKEKAEEEAEKAVLSVADTAAQTVQTAKTQKEEQTAQTAETQTEEKPQESQASASSNESDSSGASASDSQSSQSNQGSQGSSSTSQPAKPAHTHDWKEQYKQEKVWVEPSYKTVEILRCSACHKKLTGTQSDIDAHVEAHALAGENGGTYGDTEQELISDGYWDTQDVITGYKCSGCGATK